ncbi:hypothetical protein ACJ41O_007605 [Fusarium nematophilum]
MMLPKVVIAIATLALCGVDAGITAVPPTPKKHHKHKGCTPVNLIQNPSFDEPNSAGVYDGSPWVIGENSDPTFIQATILDDPDLSRTGDYSAFFALVDPYRESSISQVIEDLEVGTEYQLVYHYLVHKGQPTATDACRTFMVVDGVEFDNPIVAPVTLDTYSLDETIFTPTQAQTGIRIGVECGDPGDGFQVAIDDASLYKVDPDCPPPTDV